MQELILVISRCVSKRRSVKAEKFFYRFHFIGYYKGQKIKKIHLFSNSIESLGSITKGADYLLWVKKRRVNLEVLEVDLIKYKKII